MSKGIHWTAAEYAAYLARTNTKKSNGIEPPKKKRATRLTRRDDAVRSIVESRISGSFVADSYIEIRFEGAQMLAYNVILDLLWHERIPYKKAWHKATEWAFLAITGGQRNFPKLQTYYISYHIQVKRNFDRDGYEAALKWLQDGLVRAGVADDDGPKQFLDFDQRKITAGVPFVSVRFHRLKSTDDSTTR